MPPAAAAAASPLRSSWHVRSCRNQAASGSGLAPPPSAKSAASSARRSPRCAWEARSARSLSTVVDWQLHRFYRQTRPGRGFGRAESTALI